MIVRIMGEGQLEVGEEHLDRLNELDAAVEKAVAAGDEAAFRASLSALIEGVRAAGTPLADDTLLDSDLLLPHADASIDDVRDLLDEDGLIPG
jgi:hypothetical protein